MSQNKIYKLSAKEVLLNLATKNKYFLIGFFVKVLIAFFFASTYVTDLFAPFIQHAVHGRFWDVYNDFYIIKPNAFPYPPVMLYITALPRYLASFIWKTGSISFIDIFCLKIPLLICDVLILVILIKWLRNVKVILWYWFNPVIFYICYIHGQLDIIPTALLCAALYYLFKDKYVHFIVCLALACSTKFHIILTVPILIIYLFKTKKLSSRQIIISMGLFTILLFLLNMPFLLQPGFLKMVYQNQELGKVFASVFNLFASYNFLFIPASYIIILSIMMDFRFINKDILLIFLALSFGIFTFFIAPNQGWYLWNMPFFIYFLIRFNFRSKVVFVLLNCAYFLFFIIYPKSDFPLVAQLIIPGARQANNFYQFLILHGINASLMLQLAFTILQTTLFIFCANIFRLGVFNLRKYKIYHQPYLIGICGDSGSGKSTLTTSIAQLFGIGNSLVVRGDDMHRWERHHEKWNEFTHLNPKANWLHRDLAHLIDLKEGKRIMRKSYDHDTGKFTELSAINPNKVIIYEGLHTFYLQEASNIYDLKIFMKPSEELRRYWKIQRDVKKRGYSQEMVMAAIDKRWEDSNNYILNQETEANIVFSIEPEITNRPEDLDKEVYLKIVCSNDIFFESLIDQLKLTAPIEIKHEIDRNKQIVIVKGVISALQIWEVVDTLELDISGLTGMASAFNNNYMGIMQLFTLYYMLTQFKRNGLVEIENVL